EVSLTLNPCRLFWLPGRFGSGISANNFNAVASNLLGSILLPANCVRVPLVPVEVIGSKMLRITPFLTDWLKSPARSKAVGTVKVNGSGDASFQYSYDVNVKSLF